MNKVFIIILFVTCNTYLLASTNEKNEINTIIANGKIAICSTNMLYTPNGESHPIKKYTCLVRNANKAFLDGKIYSADDYYTPYVEEYLSKLENKKAKIQPVIQGKKNILKEHSGKFTPSNSKNKIGNLVNSSQKLSNEVIKIDNEIAKVKESSNNYAIKLNNLKAKLFRNDQETN